MKPTISYIPGALAQTYGAQALPDLLSAAGAKLEWQQANWTTNEETLVELQRQANPAILMAHQKTTENETSPIVQFRESFQCYANIRPIQSVPGLNARHDKVDLLVVRESTEDVYAQLEHESIPGVFESLKVTTRGACERIARHAFELAREQQRKKVTIVHKANIMKKSDGMFLATAKQVAQDYPDIETEDCIVDALCMKLILYPDWFDVLLCGNLFGDIVADLCAGLVGGRSNCPSANIGPNTAIFTPGHGPSGPDDISLVFSAVLMLKHLGQPEPAEKLMQACRTALSNPYKNLIPALSNAL